jgi:hypothetical protein
LTRFVAIGMARFASATIVIIGVRTCFRVRTRLSAHTPGGPPVRGNQASARRSASRFAANVLVGAEAGGAEGWLLHRRHSGTLDQAAAHGRIQKRRSGERTRAKGGTGGNGSPACLSAEPSPDPYPVDVRKALVRGLPRRQRRPAREELRSVRLAMGFCDEPPSAQSEPRRRRSMLKRSGN